MDPGWRRPGLETAWSNKQRAYMSCTKPSPSHNTAHSGPPPASQLKPKGTFFQVRNQTSSSKYQPCFVFRTIKRTHLLHHLCARHKHLTGYTHTRLSGYTHTYLCCLKTPTTQRDSKRADITLWGHEIVGNLLKPFCSTPRQ